MIRQSVPVLTLAVFVLLPASVTAGDRTPSPATRNSVTRDVVLGQDGLLTGFVLDEQGRPSAGSPVRIFFGKKQVAQTTTDRRGGFQVRGVRSGLHIVQSQHGITRCRFWTQKTAPPNAKPALLMVQQSDILRAQWGTLWTLDPLHAALAAGTVASFVIGIDALEDIGDLERRVDNLSIEVANDDDAPPASP